MKQLLWFVLTITVLAAIFASNSPDGLEYVADRFGFSAQAVERGAPLAGVLAPAAGVAGVLIILGIFRLANFIFKKSVCLIILSIFIASPIMAARPLVTDDFYTVAEGAYELEIGYASTHNQLLLANTAALSFKRGFSAFFDLGFELPYTTSIPSGMNDAYLHAKYRFWQASDNEGLTGRIDFKFNNGNINQGLGSGDNDYCLMLIYSKQYGKGKAHFNLGHVNVGMNAGIQSDDYLAYLAAYEFPIIEGKSDLVFEYVANNALQPNPAFIQIGGRIAMSSVLKLDAGYSFGLNSNSIKNSLTYGLHYEF